MEDERDLFEEQLRQEELKERAMRHLVLMEEWERKRKAKMKDAWRRILED